MATKLYFHNATTGVAGTLPASNVSISATSPTQIGSGTNRTMNRTIGAAQASVAITTGANVNPQASLIVRFVSDRLAAQTFALTGVGDISLSIAGSESNAASDMRVRISLATWRPSTGAIVTRIHDLATNATLEPGTSQTSLTATNAAGGTSATVDDGDILICEVWRDSTVQTNGTARTNTVFFDGTTEASTTTNAAFINFPNDTLIFAPQQFTQAQAQIKAIGITQFTQTQVNIKAVGQQYTQTQADIKAIGQGYTQTQADIKATGQKYTQTQAQIKAFGVKKYTQTQAQIIVNPVNNEVITRQKVTNYSIGIHSFGFSIPTVPILSKSIGVLLLGIDFPQVDGVTVTGLGYIWTRVTEVIRVNVGTEIWVTTSTTDASDPSQISINFGDNTSAEGRFYEITNIDRSYNVSATSSGTTERPLVTGIAGPIDDERGAFEDKEYGTAVALIFMVDSGSIPNLDVPITPSTYINDGYLALSIFGRNGENIYDQLQATVDLGASASYPSWTSSIIGLRQIPFGYTQAQVYIINGTIIKQFTQAQTYIKTVNNCQFIQTQVNIKQTYNQFTQTQTNIKQTYQAYTQTQIYIKTTDITQFIQSQANIKQIYNQWTQVQADIKQTYQAYTQSQADIKQTYQAYTQAQGYIRTVDNCQFTQGQTSVKAVGQAFTQAQAYIIILDVNQFTQTQTSVKQIYQAYTQAQADIKQIYQSYWQAQVNINTTYKIYTQAQSHVITLEVCRFTQTQTSIKQIYQSYTQSQTDIKTEYQQYSQTQAKIIFKQIGNFQAVTLVNGLYTQVIDTFTRNVSNGLGINDTGDTYNYLAGTAAHFNVDGTKAVITNNNTIETYSLNNTLISNGIEISGQFTTDKVPTTSNAVLNIYSHLRSDNNAPTSVDSVSVTITAVTTSTYRITVSIKGAGSNFTSSTITPGDLWNFKAHILPAGSTSYRRFKLWKDGDAEPGWTQNSNGDVFPYPGHVKLNLPANIYGNSPITWTLDNLNIIPAYITWYFQAQTKIKTINITQFIQTQASIKQVYQAYTQAQTYIKATYTQYTQTQTKINAFNVTQFTQAQTNIQFNGTTGSFQAQAKINAFDVCQWTQAQADIKATYNTYCQAQVSIKATYQQYEQAQADIKATSQSYWQAQTLIGVTSYQSYYQAQALIVRTEQAYTQAQTSIRTTYQAYTQAQGLITTNSQNYTQAQVNIKVTNILSYQAQTSIKQTYNTYIQTQASIIVNDITQYTQAQTLIIKSAGCFQAQALINQPHSLTHIFIGDTTGISLGLTDYIDERIIAVKINDTINIQTILNDYEY